MVISLVWCNIALAEKINLVCEFQDGAYMFKNGKGEIFKRGDAAASPDMTIMIDTRRKKVKRNDVEYDADFTEDQISWENEVQGNMEYSKINRLSGVYKITRFWPEGSAMAYSDGVYKCLKAEKKF